MLIDDLMVMQMRELERMYQTLTWGLFHVLGALEAVLAWYKPNLILSGRSHEDKYHLFILRIVYLMSLCTCMYSVIIMLVLTINLKL